MPRFYFDFHGDGEAGLDTEGSEFASFELAYLDAFQTMIQMGAEQLLERRGDPSTRWIDIRDASHRTLATLSFDEVFSRKPPRPRHAEANNSGYRSRLAAVLDEDISRAHARAKASREIARQTLALAEEGRVRTFHRGW